MIDVVYMFSRDIRFASSFTYISTVSEKSYEDSHKMMCLIRLTLVQNESPIDRSKNIKRSAGIGILKARMLAQDIKGELATADP